MREIKFRGKRINNGEWVYGYYVKNYYSPKLFESHHKFEHYIYKGAFDAVKNPVKYEVHPDSVGQYTGLCDKNGVEIYEGDIVANPHDTKPHHVIEWNEKQAGFMLSGSCMLMSFQMGEFWEVIGSIHTHPELLKGE